MGKIKEKFRQIKKFPDWIYWLPARLLWLFMHMFFRLKVTDPDGHYGRTRGTVAVAWHNRLMFFATIFPHCQRKWTMAVVSPSRDGQYIADFIAQLGLKSLRGSSSKKGMLAERAAIKAIEAGFNVAITPDGPRGPKYQPKPGAVVLASKTGAKIVPVSVNASRYWQVKSWDNFQIPKPFSTLTLVFGRGFSVPPELSAEDLEKYTEMTRERLMEITLDK